MSGDDGDDGGGERGGGGGLTADELAGVVDLFGGLTRAELRRALVELAYKRGGEPPGPGSVDEAVADYALVAYEPPEWDVGDEPGADDRDGGAERGEPGAERLLVAGPAAFSSLPGGAADLPHILDVPRRDVDRGALARQVEERFRAEVARAVAADDADAVERLLDVSYDLETWGPLDLGALRARLDDALSE